MIMQSAFSTTKVIPLDDAVKYMKDAILETYGLKGERLRMNYKGRCRNSALIK